MALSIAINTNNLTQHQSFVCTQMISSIVNDSSIVPINITLTGTTTSDQSGPESNGNEGVLYIPQSSRSGALPLDGLVSYAGYF